jgi:dTDP-4-amino-4,6-dideoxygalactose transaminase
MIAEYIEIFHPYVPKEAIDAVSDTLRSRWIGQGPGGDKFEKEFESFFNIKHAVAVNSGTSALETAYDLTGIGEGDEVIVTPLTCTATNLTLLRRGAKLIWADIDENTLCISQEDVDRKITDKTKAIVQVHLGGIASNIQATCPVISDACQALGIFKGDYSCFSFQAIKHITTGDGGMIVCGNAEEEKQAKLLRWFGIDREKKIANRWQAYLERRMTFDIEVPGTKRQMTDIAATMGMVGLKYYDHVIAHRKKIFEMYKDAMEGLSGIKLLDSPENVYWLATVIVEKRDDFAKMLFEGNVDSNVVQVRNDIYKVFGGKRADLPVMNALEHKYLSIPLGMHITEEYAEEICSLIKRGW